MPNHAGPEFFQTIMGHKFFENDVPRIMKALERLAVALEERNALDRESAKLDDEKMGLLRQQNEMHEQELAQRQREIEIMERHEECDCPECTARRENAQVKG